MRREICGGNQPKVNFPERTPQEGEALSGQIDLLKLSRDQLMKMFRESDTLAPFLFGEAGFDVKTGMSDKVKAESRRLNEQMQAINARMKGLDPNDPERKALEDEYTALSDQRQSLLDSARQISGISKRDDPNAPLRDEITRGWLDRVLAAQRGDLPVNPALLRDLREQEQTLNEIMRRNLGPGYATSTPGQEAFQRFGESRNLTLDAARREDMTMAEAMSLGRTQESEALRDNSLRRLLGINQRNLPGIGGLFQASSGYTAPLAYMLGERQGQFGARALNFEAMLTDPFSWRGLMQQTVNPMLQSAAGGFGAGAGAAAMSTARVKKDIEPLDRGEYGRALKKVRDMPITRWRYLWEDDTREPHVGPILELAPKEIRANETEISLLDYLGLTTAAVKGLDREVQTLRKEIRR